MQIVTKILQVLFDHIVVPVLTLVLAVVFAIVGVIVVWVVLAKLWQLISNLLSMQHIRSQPLCPACQQSRLSYYHFLPFSDAKQYRYYGCKQCKAHFKRSRRGDWVSLRPGAADRKECEALFDRTTSLMKCAPDDAPLDPLGSWFGSVQVALPGEEWPEWEGTPMLPLCQIRCEEVTTLSPTLADLAMICVFAACVGEDATSPTEKRWVVRTYASLEGLVPLPYPGDATGIRSYPIAWDVKQDAPPDRSCVPEELWIDWTDYQNTRRQRITYPFSKCGGYRTGSNSAKPLHPNLSKNFVFQIVSRCDFPWLHDAGGVLSFSYSDGSDAMGWTVDWEPPVTDFRFEQEKEVIRLGCEVEGMRIYLVRMFRDHTDYRVMEYRGRRGRFLYITDLRGLVHITTPEAALLFVRLQSSGLIRKEFGGIEVLTKLEFAAQPSWIQRGAYYPWPDEALANRTQLEPEMFQNLGFEPALVEAVEEVFRVVRWIYTESPPSKTHKGLNNAPRGMYHKIVETVKTDGTYTHAVLEERVAPDIELLRPASGPGETNPDELLRPGA